jgi:hypothetical protein
MAGTDIEVDLHHRLRKWVRSSGLPGPDEIERRISVARTAGTPGPSASVKTITLALVARRWREMGYSRREVALALSDDPRLGRPRTDGPIEDPVKERAALNCSRERAEKEAAALEQRLKRAERALRDLGNQEGTPPPPAVQDHTQRQREAGASRRSLQLQDRHADRLARAKWQGRSPDDDAACLIAEAKVIEDRANSRPDESEELRVVALRLRWRAAETSPVSTTLERDAAFKRLLEAGGFQAEPDVTIRRVDPIATRDPSFDPFTAPVGQ